MDIDLNEDPIPEADDNWRERSLLLRIKNKAVIKVLRGRRARILYKRTDANAEEINKRTKEKVARALLDAEYCEERFYTDATDKHDYQTAVSIYINSIPNTSDTIQAAMKVTSDVPQNQIIPDLSGGSSSEVQWFNIWIFLESLSVTNVSNRVQFWPKTELLFALIGCHTKTIHAVLLAFIGSHANTIYAAQQQLQQQQRQQQQLQRQQQQQLRRQQRQQLRRQKRQQLPPQQRQQLPPQQQQQLPPQQQQQLPPQQQQQYQPSSFLYLEYLVQSIESIKSHLQEQPPLTRGYSEGRIFSPPLQQQEGPSEFQKELHDEIMAFMDQIQ